MAIGGVLFDIDGVLVTSWMPIDGAAEALATLRSLIRRFVTTEKAASILAEPVEDPCHPVSSAK